MEEDYIDKHMKTYKSPCCKADAFSKGRGTLFCSICKKDIMIDAILLLDCLGMEEMERKEKREKKRQNQKK